MVQKCVKREISKQSKQSSKTVKAVYRIKPKGQSYQTKLGLQSKDCKQTSKWAVPQANKQTGKANKQTGKANEQTGKAKT